MHILCIFECFKNKPEIWCPGGASRRKLMMARANSAAVLPTGEVERLQKFLRLRDYRDYVHSILEFSAMKKNLRIISDIDTFFWTVLFRMASIVFLFFTPSVFSLIRSWYVCREHHTPVVKLICVAFQPLFFLFPRLLRWLINPSVKNIPRVLCAKVFSFVFLWMWFLSTFSLAFLYTKVFWAIEWVIYEWVMSRENK